MKEFLKKTALVAVIATCVLWSVEKANAIRMQMKIEQKIDSMYRDLNHTLMREMLR